MTNYVSFECVRQSNYGRGSGGIIVAVKETFVQSLMVKRIYPEFPECVILLIDSQLTGYNKNTILIFPYVAPEGSSIYAENHDNGIVLLSNKLLAIKSNFKFS